MSKKPKIISGIVYPDIGPRVYGAHFEGASQPLGLGATEDKAIKDLMRQQYLPTSKSDAQMERAMGPRENPVHPMFRDHNCAGCNDGAKPCKRGNPSHCDWPRARND